MSVDTRSLPGTIRKGENGEKVASGWCLVTYEMAGYARPLPEWRGEMAVSQEDHAAAAEAGEGLYIHFEPYAGVVEPWHGPVTVEPVDPDSDPNGRRLRLRSAGPLIRSRYTPEELGYGEKRDDETAGEERQA